MLYFKKIQGRITNMTLNFKSMTVFKGHPSQAIIALDDNKNPIKDAEYFLEGAKSSSTVLYGNRVLTAIDEASDILTVTVKHKDSSERVSLIVKDACRTAPDFDNDNVILTFALASDTHVSGSWNQPRSVAKFLHYVKCAQAIVGFDENGNTKLSALTVCGDFVDAVNSFGNVNGGVEHCGYKGAQNYREVSFIRSVLEGRDTNDAILPIDGKHIADKDFSGGLSDKVKFFYCLGNHDEAGKGETRFNERFTKVYSAMYFTAVFCGWKYSSEKGADTPDYCDSSYIEYAQDLVKIHRSNNSEKEKLIEEFTEKHGIDGNYAYGRFYAYYGSDTELTADEHGLFFGNRHTVIGGIHFIAIETSQSLESAEYLDKWCAASVKEDETKPIFVLTHEKVYHTIDSSYETGHSRLLEVLAKYPQAFVFTGHTHSVLTNANAIMSDCGFTAIEGSVLAYISCEGLVGRGEVPAGNYCRKEDHDSSPILMVKVDKNFGVRIEKYDLHRSFKEEYGNKIYAFGEPWEITGISSSGEHLLKYGIERSFEAFNNAPVFPDNAKVTVRYAEDGKLFVEFPAAKEDGSDLVKYYKVELRSENDENDRPQQHVTSFCFKFSDESELLKEFPCYSIPFPAQKENRVSQDLDRCVELSTPKPGVKYKAYVTAYDSWHKPSRTITSD